MQNVIWFSRHAPTPAQTEEMEFLGFTPVAVDEGMSLGGIDLQDSYEVTLLVNTITQLARENRAKNIFGVFPTPILERMSRVARWAVERGDFTGEELGCYAAWNVQRSAEGGKPTFVHRRFCYIGALS